MELPDSMEITFDVLQNCEWILVSCQLLQEDGICPKGYLQPILCQQLRIPDKHEHPGRVCSPHMHLYEEDWHRVQGASVLDPGQPHGVRAEAPAQRGVGPRPLRLLRRGHGAAPHLYHRPLRDRAGLRRQPGQAAHVSPPLHQLFPPSAD